MNGFLRPFAAAVCALAALTTTAGGAGALPCFTAHLDGAQETPPVPTDRMGTGAFTYDFDTMELTWEISHDIELSQVTAAHIHVAPVGEPGGIDIPLDHTTNPIVGSTTLSPKQEENLTGDLYYVNVHTNAYPGGEIRGQILDCFPPQALEADFSVLDSDGNLIFEPGETVEVAPAWRNDTDTSEKLTGTAVDFSGPAGATYTIVPMFDNASYGSVDPGQTASCRDTGECYRLEVDDPDARPVLHWDAALTEELSGGAPETWRLHLGDSFADVPRTSPFYGAIETLLHSEATLGCAATEYCPGGANTRAQMATFLLKSLEGSQFTPPPCTGVFDDVPCPSLFADWIEELAGRGVTSGCMAKNYCPGDAVTRAQMATFLLKSLEGPQFTPPPCTGVFDDVLCPSLFADWVEELASREITSGCSVDPPRFCPADPVTRAQMAVFLTSTFELVLYGP